MSTPLGLKLKELRLNHGWTIADLSKRSGCSISHISSLERGERTKPSMTIMQKLANALGVSVQYFFDDEQSQDANDLPSYISFEQLSNELKNFVLKEDSTPYIHLAKEIKEIYEQQASQTAILEAIAQFLKRQEQRNS
ncbi:helix-turn-helix transcriptional regulator [Fodinisporobacter ferrooxydans]|uniref:Helix-turn-helix transcriptional regulator n=1 Tax=Fodinisporobacter ferrooxydans TaxID=2901836 RepID=A0ABY4CRK5_9BACL|nr:helix-turn-helix transcriptional regulator [Alicyclobacillaceae bacterium MYW30-H2]